MGLRSRVTKLEQKNGAGEKFHVVIQKLEESEEEAMKRYCVEEEIGENDLVVFVQKFT